MLNKNEIAEGTLIATKWYETPGEITLGVIQNVRQATEKDVAKNDTKPDPNILIYDLFYPGKEKTLEGIWETSGITIDSEFITSDKAELLLENEISKNNERILTLKSNNITIKENFKKLFKHETDM